MNVILCVTHVLVCDTSLHTFQLMYVHVLYILCILRFIKVGETALFAAAYYGKTAVITELVEKGADPNIPNKVRLYKLCPYILLLISREKG